MASINQPNAALTSVAVEGKLEVRFRWRRPQIDEGGPLNPNRVLGQGVGLCVAVIVLAVVPGAVSAATGRVLYVDRTNSACIDSGRGAPLRPFCTIRAAAAKVRAGQTVEVAAGTYAENVTVSRSGRRNAPITFAAASGSRVVVRNGPNGFAMNRVSWVTVKGFTVTDTSDYGISVSNSSHITLARNHVSYSGNPISGQTRYGIRLNNVVYSRVSHNTVDHNSSSGIALVGGSNRNEVRRNHTFANAQGYERAAAGIRLFSAPKNTIAGNVTHDNEDSGIEVYPGSNGAFVYNNVAYDNGDHGIDVLLARKARIIANTVYNNVTAGINVELNSTDATLANNIAVDNGIGSPRTNSNIRVEAGSTAGTTMDYDLVHLRTQGTMLIWDSKSYNSLAAFKAATRQETHGIEADPRFAAPGKGVFVLTSDSPAIDSANSGATGQPRVDARQNPRHDDPRRPNTGAGPRAYDDRGAYEIQYRLKGGGDRH